MADEPQDFFVEMVTNVSLGNGVFRVTFAQQEANNAARSTVRLLVPANQMKTLLNGIGDAANEIVSKLGSDAAAPTEKQPNAPAPKKAPAKPRKTKTKK